MRPVTEPDAHPPDTNVPRPRKAGPLQVAKAVFWSFLGIRKGSAHEKDAVTITPLQAIVAGLIGALIFVLSLIALVRYVTS